MLLRCLLLASLTSIVTKVTGNDGSKKGPPPSFVAVAPTSLDDFDGALFPFLIEGTTTTTTTTTPAPFGKLSKSLGTISVLIFQKYLMSSLKI